MKTRFFPRVLALCCILFAALSVNAFAADEQVMFGMTRDDGPLIWSNNDFSYGRERTGVFFTGTTATDATQLTVTAAVSEDSTIVSVQQAADGRWTLAFLSLGNTNITLTLDGGGTAVFPITVVEPFLAFSTTPTYSFNTVIPHREGYTFTSDEPVIYLVTNGSSAEFKGVRAEPSDYADVTAVAGESGQYVTIALHPDKIQDSNSSIMLYWNWADGSSANYGLRLIDERPSVMFSYPTGEDDVTILSNFVRGFSRNGKFYLGTQNSPGAPLDISEIVSSDDTVLSVEQRNNGYWMLMPRKTGTVSLTLTTADGSTQVYSASVREAVYAFSTEPVYRAETVISTYPGYIYDDTNNPLYLLLNADKVFESADVMPASYADAEIMDGGKAIRLTLHPENIADDTYLSVYWTEGGISKNLGLRLIDGRERVFYGHADDSDRYQSNWTDSFQFGHRVRGRFFYGTSADYTPLDVVKVQSADNSIVSALQISDAHDPFLLDLCGLGTTTLTLTLRNGGTRTMQITVAEPTVAFSTTPEYDKDKLVDRFGSFSYDGTPAPTLYFLRHGTEKTFSKMELKEGSAFASLRLSENREYATLTIDPEKLSVSNLIRLTFHLDGYGNGDQDYVLWFTDGRVCSLENRDDKVSVSFNQSWVAEKSMQTLIGAVYKDGRFISVDSVTVEADTTPAIEVEREDGAVYKFFGTGDSFSPVFEGVTKPDSIH